MGGKPAGDGTCASSLHMPASVLLHSVAKIDRVTISHLPLVPYATRHWGDDAEFRNVYHTSRRLWGVYLIPQSHILRHDLEPVTLCDTRLLRTLFCTDCALLSLRYVATPLSLPLADLMLQDDKADGAALLPWMQQPFSPKKKSLRRHTQPSRQNNFQFPSSRVWVPRATCYFFCC